MAPSRAPRPRTPRQVVRAPPPLAWKCELPGQPIVGTVRRAEDLARPTPCLGEEPPPAPGSPRARPVHPLFPGPGKARGEFLTSVGRS
ncbi:hypothetical protein ACRRTK_021695 [Alexandromys fortis]